MAVKVYNLPALGELNKVQLIREIRLHGSMAHRNIIELYVAFQVRMSRMVRQHISMHSKSQLYNTTVLQSLRHSYVTKGIFAAQST